MQRGRDITGQKFGLLTAMHPTEERNNGSVVWHFLCDCGMETNKPLNSVTSGKVLSCGCLRGRHKAEGRNIAGQKFGKLTALHPTSERIHGSVVWRFHCDCGNECEFGLHDVKSGNTSSCGCQKHHRSIDATGQQFGCLTAICATEKTHKGCIVWRFKCLCGNEIERSLSSVRAGQVKSCGCMRFSGLRNHK